VKYILAIDQGTTGSRAIIYDKRGTKVVSSYQEFPQKFPKPGWVEHDPVEIWKSVRDTVHRVCKKVPTGSISAIGITNQRETTVIWDAETGKPVYNAIVWQCRRTGDRCAKLKKKKGESEFFKKKTGLPIDAYFSATKIEWIFKNVPGTMAKAKKGKLRFGTTDTWILWKLTGGAVHATDPTNASRTMLYDINKLKWDSSLLKRFNISKKIMPEVKPSSSIFGKTVKIGNLPAGIPISGIAGDQQAALFGQTCFEPGMMKNTYGTGSFVLINAGKKRPVSKNGLIITLGCGADGEPVYVLEGAVFVSGAAVQWLRDGLGLIKRASDSDKMARALDNNEGVYFVPALVGMGAPYWDPDARGVITGITRGTKKEHIVRAALEAMCYQTKDVIEAMQKDTGLKIKDLRVDGGAAGNDLLCQFQANILGADVIRPKIIELTSLGAAYLAGLATGYWKNTSSIKKYWKKDKVFKPRISRKEADNLYKGWKNAVSKALSEK